MKCLHPRFYKNLFILPLIIIIAVGILSFKSEKGKTTLSNYSAEDIFAGVILIKGEVAEAIPAYDELLPLLTKMEENAAYHEFRTRQEVLVREMQQRDPAYFDSFKSDMLSGDPVTINNAILTAQKKVTELLPAAQVPNGFSDLSGSGVVLGPPQFPALLLETDSYTENFRDQLKREELVNQIATLLP